MPFIGVVASLNDSNFIKNNINKESNIYKFEVINISSKTIENIKNIKFETIIIVDNQNGFVQKSIYLKKILENAKNLIINSDEILNTDVFYSHQNQLITYGLNQEATITVSSIEDDNVWFCIQKKFETINKNIVEEQEFNIEIEKSNRKKILNSIAICTVLKIYEEKIKKKWKN